MTTASLYQQIIDLPETLIGEILGGRLYTRRVGLPGRHAVVKMELTMRLFLPFDRGRDGPGGWRLISRMEVHFVRDNEVAVPDLIGWHRQRMPQLPEGHRIEVVPDWVCEILTQETAETVRNIKMPLYLQRGIRHAWLLDPDTQTLEAFEAGEGEWRSVGRATGDDQVAFPPFEAVSFPLQELWDW